MELIAIMMSVTHHPYPLLRKHWKLIFSNLDMSKHTPLQRVCACMCVYIYIFVWTYLCAWKWTFVILKVLVNVSSQYAYLIMCLCTFVQLVVSGLSTFLAVVDCTIVQLSNVCSSYGVLYLSFCFCFDVGNSFCVFLWAHCAPAFSSGLCAIEISCILLVIIIIIIRIER